MKQIRNISEKVATSDNFIKAFQSYVNGKPFRSDIKTYSRNLASNIKKQIHAFESGEWIPPEYEERFIVEHGKRRKLGIYPCQEHIMEWAILNHIEEPLTDAYIRNSCSCVRERGQIDFVDIISKMMRDDVEGTRYGVQLDVHHYFQWIDHTKLEEVLSRKITDEKVIHLLRTILESYPNGLVLGTKLSQIEANYYLVDLDHGFFSLWGVRDDCEKMHYWRRRYVDMCIGTMRTEEQKREVDKGIQYLGRKFDHLVKYGLHYARFADNIIMLSGDKVFLRLCVEIVIMILARDYGLFVNRSWNVRPVEPQGIDICGYVIHHFYRKVRKRNKKRLCRQVAKLRKKGKSPEEIRLICASRIGWLTHADCRNLIRKLDVNMEERLGKKIKRNRTVVPFEGMTKEQRRSIADYLCHIDDAQDPDGSREEETKKFILLEEYKVEDASPFPGKNRRAALRFREIDNIIDGDEPIYQWKEGELWMWTGSDVLIDQIVEDISMEDLPAPTCIHEYENRYRKKYYKFT